MRIQGPADPNVQSKRSEGSEEGRETSVTGRVDGKAKTGGEVAVVAESVREVSKLAEDRASQRSARLEALRAEVASGSFSVDLDVLANAILDDESARAGKPGYGNGNQ